MNRRKGRAKLGMFLVEGARSVESALRANAPLETILVSHEFAWSSLLAEIENTSAEGVDVYRVSSREISRVSDVRHDQGVIGIARSIVRTDLQLLDEATALLILNGVQDPGNVGSLIRTAAWFGVDAVLSDTPTADFESPKVVRSSMGGIWDLALYRTADLKPVLEQLKQDRWTIYGADLHGIVLSEWSPADNKTTKGALVLGSEAHGIEGSLREAIDLCITIPANVDATSAGVESLNVSVAGGMMLQHWLGKS